MADTPLSSDDFPYYNDLYPGAGTGESMRAATTDPTAHISVLTSVAGDLDTDGHKVRAQAQGTADPVAQNPATAAHTLRQLSQSGTFACGLISEFAGHVITFDAAVLQINLDFQAGQDYTGTTPCPDHLKRPELKGRWNRAFDTLEGHAEQTGRDFGAGATPERIRDLIADGNLPLSAAGLWPGLTLTDADIRGNLEAGVANGTIPDFRTLPAGTVQDWLEDHPEVAAHLDLFDTAAPPADATPAEANAWWASLGVMQQLATATRAPTNVGNVDGVPAWARDLANRTVLDQLREDGMKEWIKTGDEDLHARLVELRKVQETLDKGGRQLLLLDPDSGERLHAAVAVGNVDTADHVAVFTPGLTTTVDSKIQGYDADMANLKSTTEQALLDAGKPGSVATVTWIGYNAPQTSPGELLDLGAFGGRADSVTSDDLAREGGDALASFYQGINASRENDPHLTALGHSYGSTTTGFALQHENTGVDNAVVFGSPGLGTSDREDLHVDNLYRVEAKNDPVADLAQFGLDPTWMDNVTGLSAKGTEIGGTTYQESTGHSAYLDDGSTSQYNMAVTVAGLPDQQVHDDGRGAGDILTWWPEIHAMTRLIALLPLLTLTVTGCTADTDRSPSEETSMTNDATADVTGYGTGSMEDAVGRMKRMRAAMVDALGEELGARSWAPAPQQDGATIAACNRPRYDTVALRIYLSDEPIADDDWERATEIVDRIGREQGFDVVKSVVDEPGRHKLTGLAPDGGSYSLGSQAAATLSIRTGCYRWDTDPGPDAWLTIDPTD